jgi:cobalt-zinc-cadmium efflux system protein
MAVQANYHVHDGHSHHGHGHDHSHAGGSTRALAWALAVTVVFMVVEAVGGYVSGSLALVADAAHMLMDCAALGLSLFAAWVVRRPARGGRTYGWYRAEILAAMVNGVLLLLITAGIVIEAVRRLNEPRVIHTDVMLVVASGGFLANLVAVTILHKVRGESLAVRGAYLHVLSDILGSAAAIVAAIVIMQTGWTPVDPILSFLVSGLLVTNAVRLLWSAVDVLLEAAPSSVNVPALELAMAGVPGVERVHDVHVWTVASGFVAMSGHAVVSDAGRRDGALAEITERVRSFGITHVTVQLEQGGDCVGCDVPLDGMRVES